MKNVIVAALVIAGGIILTSVTTSSLEIKGHPDNNKCIGECYANYVASQGTIVEQEKRRAEAAASMSPAELGKASFVPCQACHGANGEGGVGPALSGRPADFLLDALLTYKEGGARGDQSALMWGVAGTLSEPEINNLVAYITTL